MSSFGRRAVAALYQQGRAVSAMAGLSVICVVLVAVAAFAITLATTPPPIRYVSGADGSEALVSGTSSLHAWTVKSNIINGNAEFSGPLKAGSAATITLQSIDLAIPVDTLKSTEGSGMDNTMYDALKMKQFPSITYRLTKATLKSPPSKQDPAYHFDTTGQLTVAGAAHAVNLDIAVQLHDEGKLTITTDVGLKMTDCGVTPPTAMLGMIKSGDAITVKVTWPLTMQPAGAAK
jgi:polyisoprenoid-binding protein YceI